MTATIVLASKSRSRAAVLAGAGVAFEMEDSEVDEGALKAGLLAAGAGPREVAERLGEAKALAVSARRTDALVIGADQTLDLGGALYDKPADLAEARRHLTAMRGRGHALHGGIVVAERGEVVWRATETSRLWMRDFSDAFLEAYLARGGQALLASVGCYQLEGEGAQLFERIEGDYFAILGLPLLPLLAFLRERGAIAA
ncbi:MAG TPA: Maf family protein [Caulobacteraceae bacterium]|nr:Maf family protein [Caulobacteraceae bacterium]